MFGISTRARREDGVTACCRLRGVSRLSSPSGGKAQKRRGKRRKEQDRGSGARLRCSRGCSGRGECAVVAGQKEIDGGWAEANQTGSEIGRVWGPRSVARFVLLSSHRGRSTEIFSSGFGNLKTFFIFIGWHSERTSTSGPLKAPLDSPLLRFLSLSCTRNGPNYSTLSSTTLLPSVAKVFVPSSCAKIRQPASS